MSRTHMRAGVPTFFTIVFHIEIPLPWVDIGTSGTLLGEPLWCRAPLTVALLGRFQGTNSDTRMVQTVSV